MTQPCSHQRIRRLQRIESLHGARPKVRFGQRHHRSPDELDDFRMFDFSETADIKAQASESFSILLLLIASVSLVVGGVGIMNIMLTGVSERTNEIGLRMAIGENQWTILLQFLVEAVLLCASGGIIGVLLGVSTAELLSKYADYTTIIPTWSLGAATSFFCWLESSSASILRGELVSSIRSTPCAMNDYNSERSTICLATQPCYC